MSGSDRPRTQDDSASDAVDDIAEMARGLFLASSLDETLQRVVHLAVATVEGCDYAGVFLREGDTMLTRAQTDPIVQEVDTLQAGTGQGPCVEAIGGLGTVYAEDLVDEARWPRFTPEAVERGLRSVLAYCLAGNGTVGALNLYATYPRAFGVIDRAKGLILASLAGLAIGSALAHEDEERRTSNLHAALATREVIGQAQGILMERERITADEAFDILRRASQHLNRKLREVAQDVVDTGERPAVSPKAGRPSKPSAATGTGAPTGPVTIVKYALEHLPGVIALCEAEGWPSFPEDPERAHRALTAPGVTSVVATEGDRVVGFAYLQSDGEVQAHLSLIAVEASERRRGTGRRLLAEGLRQAGGLRVDLVTDSALEFYESLPKRRLAGYRVYPASPPGADD